jgi:exopolyphosphatase/guanosine-5'-triphosphate,3'-diphosphate pyrophosphatase
MQSLGAVPFKNYIIEAVQGKDPSVIKSPNPISQEDWEKADELARYIGRHAIPYVKERVSVVEGKLVGIGRLFANSIKPMGSEGKITRKDLREFIRSCIGKTDEELGDPFANVNVSNAILVLGVMKGLHIHEVSIIETTSTKGIIGYKPYWTA